MKKIIITILGIIILNVFLFAQEKTLILMHPTKYNLDLFTNLLDQKIINIEDLNIVGIYHTNENYDYSESINFIQENNYTNITLKEILGEIEANRLYQDNACTQEYKRLFQNSAGIIFFGGPDLPPGIYNEKMSLLTRMTDPYRHYFEASFMFHLLGGSQNDSFIPLLEENPDYVVYAICLGMQTMNIATGGTMIQDIPSEVYNLNFVEDILETDNNQQHRNYYNNLTIDSTLFAGNFHQIKITNLRALVNNYKENLMPFIYSNHHQAIETLGKNLNVIATSVDGKIIEAIVHKTYPNVLGIQFHPEGKYLHDYEIKYRKSPNDKLNSGKQFLEENNSYQFHLELWKCFSDKLNSK